MNNNIMRESERSSIGDLSEIFDSNPVSQQTGHFLANLGFALRKFKILIVLSIIVFTILGWYNTAKKPFLFQSTLTMINEPDLNLSSSGSEGARYLVYLTQHYYETQHQILSSKKLAELVAQELIKSGINVPSEPDNYLNSSPFYEWIQFAKEKIKLIFESITQIFRGAEDNQISQSRVIGDSNVDENRLIRTYTNKIKSGLSISAGNRSQLIVLRYVSTDPKFSAEILNLIAKVYQEYILQSKQQYSQTTLDWLVAQLEIAKENLLASEKTLIDYQKKILQSESGVIEAQGGSLIADLSNKYRESRINYEEALARYGSRHPDVRKARIELDYLKRSLDNATGESLNSRDVVFELDKFEKEVDTNRELYLSYLSRFNSFNIADNQNNNTIKVLDKAEIPGAPFSPNLKEGVFLWAVFGVVFGVITSLLLSFLDRTFKTIEDIEHILRLPVLGQLPFLSNKVLSALVSGRKQIPHPEVYYTINSKSIFSEAINHIRTNLLFSKIDKQPQTILITSSVQAEGKTTVATNLAFSLSQIDKTILIDADLRKPRIANVFSNNLEGHEGHGLVDYIAGLSSFDESTYQHHQFQNLTILPSGTIPPNPQELLASSKFIEFIEKLKSEYKYVIIDTAPVLPVSDSLILGKIVDVLLVAVKAGSTTIKMTRETIKRLNIARVYPTGLVLTQLEKPNKAYGKHGLNYYYSYYGKKENEVE